MANPPPPYDNITGISRTVMKDNAQETIGNYNGNARPGEMVVNLLNNDIYIGNTNGGLTLISTASGSGNGVPAGSVGDVQFNAGGNLFGASANLTFATDTLTTVNISTGNITTTNILNAGTGNIFVTGNLLPGGGYNLGLPTLPWANAYFGPDSITILDQTGNISNAVVISNESGNTIVSAGGFIIQGNGIPIFRVAALTGQVYSNAQTIIQNATQAANTTSGSLQTAGGVGIAKDLYVGGNITSAGRAVISSLYQAGGATQGVATPLDLRKQVHILADSWFSLADGEEGQICHFTMNNTASAEDILIEMDHLKISQSGAATTLVNAVWNPFPFGSGNFVATLATAVFTGNAWSVSQGTIV